MPPRASRRDRVTFRSPAPGAVAVRPAATVVLVRDAPSIAGGQELQVLMVRRDLAADFVGGAYVFPGGGVDPLDGGAEAESLCRGRSGAEASEAVGVASGGLAYWVAAARETFEETGILLARRLGAPPPWAGGPVEQARLAEARAEVNAGGRSFLDLCRAEHLELSAGDVHYFARWITPLGSPRRYDTRFFVAAAPVGQTASSNSGETIAAVWIAPHDALARHRSGEIDLIVPTVRTLQAVGRFGTAAALLRAAAAVREVTAIEARVVVDDDGLRLALPGDPGYEKAALSRAVDADLLGDLNDAIRAASMQANLEGQDAAAGPLRPEPS